MSGGNRARERRTVRDEQEEMTIRRWLNRREESITQPEPTMLSENPKEVKGSGIKLPKTEGTRTHREDARGILSNRRAKSGAAVKESPMSNPTPQCSVGVAKKVQFSEDDIIQVISPHPKNTPFVKPDRSQSRKLRRTAARMKLYKKKYGTPLPEEYYDITPPSLVEALDKEMADQIRKKLRSKIMSQIRLQQLSTRSSDDDHLPLLNKCDKPNCGKKGSCVAECSKASKGPSVTPASSDRHVEDGWSPEKKQCFQYWRRYQRYRRSKG
ncbi:hypothetical protein BIW11_00065 [Tropilaelaps mercedesae]|uniref:Uncharacterized protein n=1 Tax=Tropilaelaps mercedesae TaxID=418985 RepID=A0A1V9Y354_9ACAR|nr:hypothetical protein BIW11_00065 [Tropilaelaps mercedesae]